MAGGSGERCQWSCYSRGARKPVPLRRPVHTRFALAPGGAIEFRFTIKVLFLPSVSAIVVYTCPAYAATKSCGALSIRLPGQEA